MKFFKFFLMILFLFLLCSCSKDEKITQVDYIKIDFNNKKSFYGVVKANNSATLSFQSEGKIIYLPYTKGDFVKKGDVIARLDGELYAIRKNEEQSKLQEYLVRQNKQKSYYKRLDILHSEGAISDNDWESAFFELQTLEQQIKVQKEKIKYILKEISYNIIVAPFDGYIGDKFLDVGSYAKIGTSVVDFISSNGVQVEVMVGQNDINKIKIGDKVSMKISNANYQGNIAHISKSSLKSGGYLVKILVNASTNLLKEGMSANVELISDEFNGIFLPLTCVYEKNNEKYIYKIVNIKNNIGEIKRENIKVGIIRDDKIEILDGVSNQDIVLVNFDENNENKKVKL